MDLGRIRTGLEEIAITAEELLAEKGALPPEIGRAHV